MVTELGKVSEKWSASLRTRSMLNISGGVSGLNVLLDKFFA